MLEHSEKDLVSSKTAQAKDTNKFSATELLDQYKDITVGKGEGYYQALHRTFPDLSSREISQLAKEAKAENGNKTVLHAGEHFHINGSKGEQETKTDKHPSKQTDSAHKSSTAEKVLPVLSIDKHDQHEATNKTATKAEHGSAKHSDKQAAGASKDSHKEGTAKNKPDVDDLIEKRNAHLFQGLLDTGKAIGDGVSKSITGVGEAIAKTANDAIHTAEKSTIEAAKSPVVQDEIEVLKAQQRQIAEDEHKMTAARAKMKDGFSKFVSGLGDEIGAELKEIGDFFKI